MNEDLQLLADVTNMPTYPGQPSDLAKTMTTSTGFLGINLESYAKWMMPFYNKIRRRIPSVAPKQGAAQAQWRMQLGESGFDYAAAFGTANGGNGSDVTAGATTILADYTTQSVRGSVQVEAIYQAMGYDDPRQLEVISALTRLFKLEEFAVVYGNRAALAAPVITGNYSSVHALAGPVFSNATWHVRVTALTGIGTVANKTGNSNNGETVVSNSLAIAVGASGADYLDVSWPEVPGALGYKVYCEAVANSGTYYLVDPATQIAYPKYNTVAADLAAIGDSFVVKNTGQTFVHINHVQILSPAVNTQPNDPGAVDHSANTNMFEGIYSWCTKSTIYGQSLPYRLVTDMGGFPLTVRSTGILEFDNILQAQFDNNHTSPSLILCSSNSIVSMSNKIASAGNNNQYRLDVYPNRNGITGGLYINGYINKFAADQIDMRPTIPVSAHPYLPDGTFIFLSEDVPAETLPYSRTGKIFELDTPIPYSYFPLASTDRNYPFDAYYNETLKCYYPSAQSAITCARVDN